MPYVIILVFLCIPDESRRITEVETGFLGENIEDNTGCNCRNIVGYLVCVSEIEIVIVGLGRVDAGGDLVLRLSLSSSIEEENEYQDNTCRKISEAGIRNA